MASGLQFADDEEMRRISVILALFLVASIAGAITAASPSSTVKAEVPHGVISIAFDDNYQNQYEYAFPLMENYGIVGTFYVRTDRMGISGYMTAEQLRDLQSAGNEIGSHSHTHTTFTSLSETAIRNECSISKQILEEEGLTVRNFAYPNGPTSNTIDSIVSEYYRSGRTAYVEPYLMDAPTSQFRVAGFSAETADPTALSLLKGMVDQVHAANGWAIIFFHNVIPNGTYQPYTTSTEDFESFLDYVVSTGVETLTVNQVLDLTSFSISSNFGSVTPASGIYSLGETITIEALPPPSVDGESYVWLGWTGSGAGSYTGLDNPALITFNGSINQTGLWRHEFKLSILTDYGTTSPSSGEYWYEAGTNVNIEAFAPPNDFDERYLFEGWKGTGEGSYSGSTELASVVMNSSITQAASWGHQYEISIVWSGVGSDISESMVNVDGSPCANGASFWLNSGSSHNFGFQSALDVSSTERYVWEYSSGLSTQRGGSFFVSGSGTLSATYKTQFLLDVISPYGEAVGTGWYDSGSTAYATLDRSTNASSDVRQLFVGWSGNASGNNLTSDPILVDGPKTATALWKKQFLVVFDQIGLPNDYSASILVDSANHNLPFSVWADDGASMHFAYPNHFQNGFGAYYALEYPLNQSSIDVDSSVTMIAHYTMKYDGKHFLIILIPAIFLISSAGFVLLLKRRK